MCRLEARTTTVMNTSELTLAIEASNPSAACEGSGPGVALGRVGPGGVELLGVELLRSAARHDDDLMPAVDRLWSRLAGEGLVRDKTDLARIAVSIGPGGFTGLRVAVTAAKCIAEAVGALCVPVPSASVVARRAAPDLPRPFAVALASKRETTVVTVFDDADRASASPSGHAREIDADALQSLGCRALIADRFLPDSIRARCAELDIRIDEPVFDPAACLAAAALIDPIDPAKLVPLYGREPEAVRKWRELHG